jgi:hypothetical protein
VSPGPSDAPFGGSSRSSGIDAEPERVCSGLIEVNGFPTRARMDGAPPTSPVREKSPEPPNLWEILGLSRIEGCTEKMGQSCPRCIHEIVDLRHTINRGRVRAGIRVHSRRGPRPRSVVLMSMTLTGIPASRSRRESRTVILAQKTSQNGAIKCQIVPRVFRLNSRVEPKLLQNRAPAALGIVHPGQAACPASRKPVPGAVGARRSAVGGRMATHPTVNSLEPSSKRRFRKPFSPLRGSWERLLLCAGRTCARGCHHTR